jgi:low affinity Fe/Cu permease
MTMPTEEDGKVGFFDKFATTISDFSSRAVFFAFCVLLVVLWAPSYFLIQSVDTWQLIINTITTIVTFLLVALLQNTQKRGNDAIQQKLNALAKHMLADTNGEADAELKDAIGLEHRETSD